MAKRKRSREGGPAINITLVMTISLFLILLTFFILLNSIAVIDEQKKLLVIGSLMGAFGALPGGILPANTGEYIMSPFAPVTDERLDIVELISLVERMMVGQVKHESSKDREVITINESVLFGVDKHQLKPSALPLLNKICGIIRKGDYPVQIVGHTDSRPGTNKGFKSNWELSSLMAIQVLKYFVGKGGVSAERFSAYGRGSTLPVASNATRESRAQNRRVEVILDFSAPLYVKRIFQKRQTGTFTYKNFDFKLL
jgi:chemotaxis protein MotB